jgi:hypothetical protein
MGRPIKKQPARRTVAIVGDGETERIYFSDVKDTDRPANLSIFPDYPRKIGSYAGVLERAIQLKNNYDDVYALIDMDKVIQDRQKDVYYGDKAKAESAGVIVLENNPCFEMWLLLHFVKTAKLFKNCSEVVVQLKKTGRIPGYSKSERFLSSARLYGKFKRELVENAIPNARSLEVDRKGKDELYPRAEVFRFFEWYNYQRNESKH